jgi:5-methylcytosine-specific restriction endonuclease McrA
MRSEAVMSKSNAYDSHHRKMRALVLAEAGHVCAYCGGEATTVDHVQEVALGGLNVRENYVAACVRCNTARGGALGAARKQAKRLKTSRRW